MKTLLAIVIFVVAYIIWREIKNSYNYFKELKKIEWVMLELKLPTLITKSPSAMELILARLHLGGPVPPWYSFEIVSIGGAIHFYIFIPKKLRGTIEAAFYSQYPGLEIDEAEDYSRGIELFGPDDVDLHGVEMKLAREDAFPIRTYIDFNMGDTAAKDEDKVEPMAPTLEFLASLGPHEQCWVQIIATKTGKRFDKDKLKWYEKLYKSSDKQDWKEEARALIKDMVKKEKKEPKGDEDAKEPTMMDLSPGQTDVVKAIERSVAKPGFDCGIRMIYIAPKEYFSSDNKSAMPGILGQYSTASLNSIEPDLTTQTGVFYKHQVKYLKGTVIKWREDSKVRKLGTTKQKKKDMLEAYRLRSYFHLPHKGKPFILNTEELATIYHIAQGVVSSSGMEKIESRTLEPPTNLPS